MIKLASVNFFIIWLIVLGGFAAIKIIKNYFLD